VQVSEAPGEQTPSPVQLDQLPQTQETEQVRDCEPQLPHPWLSVAPDEHSPPPLQAPQMQPEVQVCVPVPQLPQPWVAPGEHTPPPLQEPHVQSPWQVCDPVPQLPQPWVAPGEQTPPPLQAPQVQLAWQVCDPVPQLPQLWVAPGEQTPPPPQVPQVQLEVQVCVPQLPQPWVVPGEQTPVPPQVPQVQLEVQVCVPQLPQPWVAPGEQTPSPPQEPHWQMLSHVRVPQLPQPSESPIKHALPYLRFVQSGHTRHMQSSLQPLERVPQLPLPQSCVSVSPTKHWLPDVRSHVPHSPQSQVSVQPLIWVPQLPPPQGSSSVSTPGVVQAHMLFSHGPHVQALPQSWPPVHEAMSVQPLASPTKHSKPSSLVPLQSLSLPSQISVGFVIVHSQPFSMLPSALPKPTSHEMPQAPPLQVLMEAGRSGQAAPQALQLNGSFCRSAQ
jgi:hypothetical protein